MLLCVKSVPPQQSLSSGLCQVPYFHWGSDTQGPHCCQRGWGLDHCPQSWWLYAGRS